MIDRVTPEMAWAAYEATGLYPESDGYFDDHEGMLCGCPAFAVAIAAAPEPQDLLARVKSGEIGSSSATLRAFRNRSYVNGFTHGVDNDPVSPEWLQSDDQWKLGYEDGVLVRESLWPTNPEE